ncbi:related to Sno-type pyridoxine vitamin B6 biosynthetic protein SNO1 [Melanopsichium pennsylvanicum]|uniref:glutaminase n=2 Tax=Melanopsichium pennsylvanicum TaxID=63383 RepID=A0AAJ5C8H2_9BASI|nr:related to Sno-type pyridoxine vitamin B6 biosynthetic protein SNO1 [Melanopsichium pennsylvanicum 4]SNX88007.1 related to Sno-type pyridoxine vitamin B6 biosynthetic protein SNO1 [Melanopsichium pennsylvanicum]
MAGIGVATGVALNGINGTSPIAPSTPSTSSCSTINITIGVLAIQGAFREHASHVNRLQSLHPHHMIRSTLVRTPEQLADCDALIIPGGESTAISLGCERIGLLEPIRKWVRDGKPVWGTCAGMIMLAREASGGKKGGQQLIGGVDVRVGRNGFGSQIDSFETGLTIHGLEREQEPFNGVFIRAPVVDALLLPSDLEKVAVDQPTLVKSVDPTSLPETVPIPITNTHAVPLTPDAQLPTNTSEPPLPKLITPAQAPALRIVVAPPLYGTSDPIASAKQRPPIEILATLPEPVTPPKSPSNQPVAAHVSETDSRMHIARRPDHDSQIVALRQGNILMTSFHPELTPDTRLHNLFVTNIVGPYKSQQQQ